MSCDIKNSLSLQIFKVLQVKVLDLLNLPKYYLQDAHFKFRPSPSPTLSTNISIFIIIFFKEWNESIVKFSHLHVLCD